MTIHATPFDRGVQQSYAFLARAIAWNLALFGLIRLTWFDQHVVGGLVEFQKALVLWYGATPPPGIVVDSSCSGADVMALCVGVLLAYPAVWRRRVAGVALGIGGILALNAVRIATLYAVASSRETLDLLHLYVWPAILTIATVAFVYAWIRAGERPGEEMNRRWTRFGLATLVALGVYVAVVPWVLTSPLVLEAGVWTASSARTILAALGADVRTSGAVLLTNRGAFLVTQECLFTPMIPLYLAAVFSLPLTRRRRAAWLLAALPIFFALGVARVLVLALPAQIIGSPLFLIHGFYQLVLGAVFIIGAAHLAERGAHGLRATWVTTASLALAAAASLAASRIWEPVLLAAASAVQTIAPATLTSLVSEGEPQGALALLPAYHVGLLSGLWFALSGARRRTGRLLLALSALFFLQLALLAGLGALAAWFDLEPHAILIRGIAVAVPVLLAAICTPAVGSLLGDRTYQQFWHDVGEEFPSLTGAESTTYYFENEKRLIAEALPTLAGCTLLKTDLWDEAKNTRIMQWAADQGARVYGIDLSEPIVREARNAFGRRPLRPAVGDVRRLPFADGSFDAIYSMGTIEHFAETEASVTELARVLKPGGRLILGVPNRHDPFLRPALVALLNRLNLYGYGYEKSYSRRELRRMIEAAGLTVTLESGILFMPGWLRMLDLWCHTRARPLTRITGALVRPFAWFDARIPWLRRHGYLLASVGTKPAPPPAATATSEPASEEQRAPGLRWQFQNVTPAVGTLTHTGTEYVVDARGCDREALVSLPRLQRLFAEVHADLGLQPMAPPVWHVFPGEGGVTGLVLLSESHLTIHTYPEFGVAAINLYCCRPSAEWPWETRLRSLLGATEITVRTLRRG